MKKERRGRPANAKEVKKSYTVSLYPADKAKIVKKYGSLTLAMQSLK